MELVMVGKLKRCNEVDMHCTDQVMCLCVWVFKNAWCHGVGIFLWYKTDHFKQNKLSTV